MRSKVIFSIFIFMINCNVIFGQLDCFYNTTGLANNYACHLTMNNPDGLNNFDSIGGEHLPGYTYSNVRSIYGVPGSNSQNFPSIICEKFAKIISIDLTNMGIQRIDDFSFRDCPDLSILYMINNNISIVDEAAFSRNPWLRIFLLQGNQLATLPENVFQHTIIDYMYLAKNMIVDLPKNIFSSLVNMTTLVLKDNKIENLRIEWFENLQDLYHLHLDNNNIQHLPKNVFKRLSSLSQLTLGLNNLKIIHADSFGFLPSLRLIDVPNNQIDAIDEDFIDNTSVSSISMIDNLCADRRITDNSISRDVMKAELRTCFDNFKNISFYDQI